MTNSKISIILLTVLFLWFAISILRSLNNFSKLRQDVHLLSMTSLQKRKYFFGLNENIVENLNRSNFNVPVIILHNEGISYFYIRYRLYPVKVYYDSKIPINLRNKIVILFNPSKYFNEAKFLKSNFEHATLIGNKNIGEALIFVN